MAQKRSPVLVKVNTEFMKQRRAQLGLSQQDVAYKLQQMGLKVSGNHYSRIERGQQHHTNPPITIVMAIAKVLKCSVEDLYTFEPLSDPVELTPTQKTTIIKDLKKTIKYQVGQKMKEVREQRGITLEEIGNKLGIHPTYIWQIEHGKAGTAIMLDYAKVLGIEKEVEESLSL